MNQTNIEAKVRYAPRGKRGEVNQKQMRHPKIGASEIMSRTWYALCVTSQREFAIQDILSRMGFVSFVPVRKEWRFPNRYAKAKRQKVLKSYCNVPGYVFVGFDAYQGCQPNWLRFFDKPHVFGVVGLDGEPYPVKSGCMIRLAKHHANGLQRPDQEAYQRTHGEYRVGDRVRVCVGPFEGMEVPVVELRKGKAVIEIDVFSGTSMAEVDSFDLEKAT